MWLGLPRPRILLWWWWWPMMSVETASHDCSSDDRKRVYLKKSQPDSPVSDRLSRERETLYFFTRFPSITKAVFFFLPRLYYFFFLRRQMADLPRCRNFLGITKRVVLSAITNRMEEARKSRRFGRKKKKHGDLNGCSGLISFVTPSQKQTGPTIRLL